eukprot:GHVP01013062.1.p1 GENE.GHVP01013062.1~~GHVP01013062.1.p1  ORF type:complete len:980 (+),score=143.50 GHVP01013062.1:513-3452(+)
MPFSCRWLMPSQCWQDVANFISKDLFSKIGGDVFSRMLCQEVFLIIEKLSSSQISYRQLCGPVLSKSVLALFEGSPEIKNSLPNKNPRKVKQSRRSRKSLSSNSPWMLIKEKWTEGIIITNFLERSRFSRSLSFSTKFPIRRLIDIFLARSNKKNENSKLVGDSPELQLLRLCLYDSDLASNTNGKLFLDKFISSIETNLEPIMIGFFRIILKNLATRNLMQVLRRYCPAKTFIPKKDKSSKRSQEHLEDYGHKRRRIDKGTIEKLEMKILSKDNVDQNPFAKTAPFSTVARFLFCIVQQSVPSNLYGGQKALRKWTRNLCRSFYCCKLRSVIRPDVLIRDMRLSICPHHKVCHKMYSSSAEASFISQYILWSISKGLLTHVFLPLISESFYITHSESHANRLLFFRKVDWTRMCRNSVKKFLAASKAPRKIAIKEDCHIPLLKWCPNAKGHRPLIPLNKKVSASPNLVEICKIFGCTRKSSTNQCLSPIHSILSDLLKKHSKQIGASVMGYQHLRRSLTQQWKNFCNYKLANANSSCLDSSIKIVIGDLKDCYENIQHSEVIKAIDKLLALEEISSHRVPSMMVQKFLERRIDVSFHESEFISSNKKTTIKWRKTEPISNFCRFQYKFPTTDIIQGLKLQLRIPLSRVEFAAIPHIRSVIGVHLQEHKILIPITGHLKVLEEKGKGRIGLPQGSNLSPLLCALALGSVDIDKENPRILKPNLNGFFTEPAGHIFCRWVDDFLFVTLSEVDSNCFLEFLKDRKIYGENIHEGKLISQVLKIGEKSSPWCGIQFQPSLISHKANCCLVAWKDIKRSSAWDSILLFPQYKTDKKTSILENVRIRILAYCRVKLHHGLFTDRILNSRKTVQENLHKIGSICGLKFLATAKDFKSCFGFAVSKEGIENFCKRLESDLQGLLTKRQKKQNLRKHKQSVSLMVREILFGLKRILYKHQKIKKQKNVSNCHFASELPKAYRVKRIV